MKITTENVKIYFESLEPSLLYWHQNAEHELSYMDDADFCRLLQSAYQMVYESLCMEAKLNRTDFGNYPGFRKAWDEMNILELFEVLFALNQCVSGSQLSKWRVLNPDEKETLKQFDQLLVDVCQCTIGVESVSAEDLRFG